MAELSECVATIFSLWLAAQPVQPATTVDSNALVDAQVTERDPAGRDSERVLAAAQQQHGSNDLNGAVNEAARKSAHSEGVAAGSAKLAIVMEGVRESAAAQHDDTAPPREPDQLGEATDAQPVAAGTQGILHKAISHGQAPEEAALAYEGAAEVDNRDHPDPEFAAVTGKTAAAAEGGIRGGVDHSAADAAPTAAADLQTDESSGGEASAEGEALIELDDLSNGQRIVTGIVDNAVSPSGAAIKAETATAVARSPDSGDDYGEAALDGMAALDEDAADDGFDVFGNAGGSSGSAFNADYAGDALANWDASADDAMQFGARCPSGLSCDASKYVEGVRRCVLNVTCAHAKYYHVASCCMLHDLINYPRLINPPCADADPAAFERTAEGLDSAAAALTSLPSLLQSNSALPAALTGALPVPEAALRMGLRGAGLRASSGSGWAEQAPAHGMIPTDVAEPALAPSAQPDISPILSQKRRRAAESGAESEPESPSSSEKLSDSDEDDFVPLSKRARRGAAEADPRRRTRAASHRAAGSSVGLLPNGSSGGEQKPRAGRKPAVERVVAGSDSDGDEPAQPAPSKAGRHRPVAHHNDATADDKAAAAGGAALPPPPPLVKQVVTAAGALRAKGAVLEVIVLPLTVVSLFNTHACGAAHQ